MKENIGNEIEISLFKAIDKIKQFSGVLTGFDNDKIYIKINQEDKEIDRSQISQIKLKYNW